ncbi:Regulator of chromosome condensation (RCC1) family protein [Zea mays]|uniref:Regulator of chromosome condensation (RCC1) family protein n=1 Tax=Zea mays TaxID=4577 RepID=A0A1D6NA30_MAIZE|nr:Regulator of chromosome condensation (RCC1) family protein [Zea mays]
MKEAMAVAALDEIWWREPEEEAPVEWTWSWGAGTDGQLGNGGFDDHHLPQPLLLPTRCRSRVSFVAGGGAHAIALTSDGEVFTWGRGTHGQLGHGNLDNMPHPKLVKFLENHTVTCVSAGWNHSGFATVLIFRFWATLHVWRWLIWTTGHW